MFELGSYFFNALFMIARPQAGSLWYMILSLIHPIRALIGLYVVRLLPQSQDFFSKMQISGNKQLSYKQTIDYLSKNSRMVILDYYHLLELPVKIYTLATLICVVLDVLAALIFLIFEGKKDGRGVMFLA